MLIWYSKCLQMMLHSTWPFFLPGCKRSVCCRTCVHSASRRCRLCRSRAPRRTQSLSWGVEQVFYVIVVHSHEYTLLNMYITNTGLPGGCRGLDFIEEQVGEEKVAKVIGANLHLEPVLGLSEENYSPLAKIIPAQFINVVDSGVQRYPL